MILITLVGISDFGEIRDNGGNTFIKIVKVGLQVKTFIIGIFSKIKATLAEPDLQRCS